MDTKLRRISTNAITKLVVLLLFVIFTTMAFLYLQYAVYRNLNPEPLFVEDYLDSQAFLSDTSLALTYTYELTNNRYIINGKIDFIYYIAQGESVFSNIADTHKRNFEQYDVFYGYENGVWSYGTKAKPTNAVSFLSHNLSNESTLYLAFPDEYLKNKQEQWQTIQNQLKPLAAGIIISSLLALITFIWSISATGRKPEDNEIHLSRVDHIYSDILLLLLVSVCGMWVLVTSDIIRYSNYHSVARQAYEFVISGFVTALVAALSCMFLLSLVRKIKAGKLLKHSLIYTAGYLIYDFCRSLFDGRLFKDQPLTRSLFLRQLLFIAISAVLVFFTIVFVLTETFLVLLPPILEGVIIYWYIKGNNKTFEEINQGFDESMEEKMRAERMKVALVTNVSHDLKTPLTSIISYTDLLAKEEDLPETAKDYVRILSQKANRLKTIVADLFDLAKSTSGNIALDLESLDLKKLIEQTLGDMQDQIGQTDIQVKTSLPDHPVNIYADGKKLYRVFQNVIDNALKYSHSGTRVYLDLREENGKAVATIKNTAGYEMNFTAEEILQRFNRGDQSRSTDGSGLGLSIAESFTNVCGGMFGVTIDGDLFKVMISFPAEQ